MRSISWRRVAPAWPAPWPTSAATFSTPGPSRSASTSLAPSAARRRAVAAPMPRAAPVTSTTRPWRRALGGPCRSAISVLLTPASRLLRRYAAGDPGEGPEPPCRPSGAWSGWRWSAPLVGSRPAREGAAQQLPGERPRRLAVAQQDLAVHHRRRDAARALHEALRPGGKVVHHLRHLRRHRVGVEDDEGGGGALAGA